MVLCSGKLTSVCRLSTVYNILGGNGTARYNTFYAMITYAAEAGKEHLAAVTPHCAHLESMFSEWGTDLDKQRALYTAIFYSLKKHNNRYILTFKMARYTRLAFLSADLLPAAMLRMSIV